MNQFEQLKNIRFGVDVMFDILVYNGIIEIDSETNTVKGLVSMNLDEAMAAHTVAMVRENKITVTPKN